jgi:hypothetical protein
MKIRYYQHINGARWIGFGLAMMSVFILSSANISTQWVGLVIKCSILYNVGVFWL